MGLTFKENVADIAAGFLALGDKAQRIGVGAENAHALVLLVDPDGVVHTASKPPKRLESNLKHLVIHIL